MFESQKVKKTSTSDLCTPNLFDRVFSYEHQPIRLGKILKYRPVRLFGPGLSRLTDLWFFPQASGISALLHISMLLYTFYDLSQVRDRARAKDGSL